MRFGFEFLWSYAPAEITVALILCAIEGIPTSVFRNAAEFADRVVLTRTTFDGEPLAAGAHSAGNTIDRQSHQMTVFFGGFTFISG